jgi:hypothetical protein
MTGGPALAITAVTALSFFVFPGHTYLEQDTQIYVPILEHQWSGALANDLIVEHPHVSFTLYDELANALRWLTRLPLQLVLEAEQVVFRGLGFLGIYLIALSFGLDSTLALSVMALWALGASIKAPAVLTIEYEPTPRSFAVPLLMLAVGLALRRRFRWSGVAAAGAVLLHAPTTWPFLAVAAVVVVVQRSSGCRHRGWSLLVFPLIALVALAAFGFRNPAGEHQSFLGQLGPAQEALQRMRASYSYVSTWWSDWAWQYEFFAAVAIAGLWRVSAAREQWMWLGGLVVAGLLSVPLSWILLEHFHRAVTPQVQPARALLFVTGVAVLVSAVAAWKAVLAKRRIEATLWFLFCLLVPAHAVFFEWPGWRIAGVLFAASIAHALLAPQWRVATVLLAAPLLAYGAGVSLYGHLGTTDLSNLSQWARVHGHGVYLFPEAGRDRAPGWFRATALQPVYVDWKGGGQVNYLQSFSEDWADRWNQVNARGAAPENYLGLPVDYLVYPQPLHASLPLVYHNPSWWVYHLSAHGLSR